jgi:hypothetical protein
MEFDEIVDPFNLGMGYPTCTIGNNANVLLDGPIQLYDSKPADFTAMDTTDSETRRWDQNAVNRSQALFRLGDENVVVQEGFTSFDQVIFTPFSDAFVLFDASEEPFNYTNGEWNIQPGSLLDNGSQTAQIHSQPREIPQRAPPTGGNDRSRRPARKQEGYPTPATSLHSALDEDDERDEPEYESDSDEYTPPSPRKSPATSRKPARKPPIHNTQTPTIKKRRNGHTPGINRQTGQLTLIGRFPPIYLGDNLLACPHCYNPNDIEHSTNPWTTRNGYKYHLDHVCPANPESTASEKVRAAAEAGQELARARKKDFLQQCDVCDSWFKSDAGYKAHRETNLTTRNGLCINKGRWKGRPVEEESEMRGEEEMEFEGGAAQMATYEMMRAGPMQGTDYYVWQAAVMAVQQGRTQQSAQGYGMDIQ